MFNLYKLRFSKKFLEYCFIGRDAAVYTFVKSSQDGYDMVVFDSVILDSWIFRRGDPQGCRFIQKNRNFRSIYRFCHAVLCIKPRRVP